MNRWRKFELMMIIAALVAAVFILACDEGSSGGGDSDDDLEIEGTSAECNVIYMEYEDCVIYCSDGMCLRDCILNIYPNFLDCCRDFEADVTCLQSCLSNVETCFDGCTEDSSEEHRACFYSFVDCENACPPPLAQVDAPVDQEQ